MPNLSDPLGAPKIVTGPEYLDALANLGYRVDNMTSSLPTITKIAEAGTSLLDKAYQENLDYQKAQSDMAYSHARAGYLDSETDYNTKALDLRLKDLELNDLVRQQTLASANAAQPIRQHLLENQGKASDIALANAQSLAQDQSDAQDKLIGALKVLPDPSGENFKSDIDKWQTDNAALLSRTDSVGKQAQNALGMVQGRYKGTSQFNQRMADVKEFEQLQSSGYIGAPYDADQMVFSGQAQPALIKGRMLAAQDQLQQIASDLSVPQIYREYAQNMHDYVHRFVTSDTGVADVQADKASLYFNSDGRLNARAAGAINGINAARGQKPVEAEARVPLTGVSGKVGKEETPYMTLKGTQQQVQAALTPYEQQQQREAEAKEVSKGIPDTPENLADKAAYQRGEIPFEELTRRVNGRIGQQQQNQQLDAAIQARMAQDPAFKSVVDKAKKSNKPSDWAEVYRAMGFTINVGASGFQEGGAVSQYGTTDAPASTDTVPAMLTPGEYVLSAPAARSIGAPALDTMNRTGQVPGRGVLPIPSLQPLAGSPLQPMPMPNIARALGSDRGQPTDAAVAAAAKGTTAQKDQQPSTTPDTGGFFLNPATGSYEPLQTTARSTAPVSARRASGSWTTGVGTEFGEVDNPAYGGYTEPNWNLGKWGDKISGWDTEGVALPNAPRGTIVEIRNPKTGQTVTAPVKDHGPGPRTGASIDLLAGTRAKLGLPKNSSYNLEFRIVSGPQQQQTAGMQAGGTVTPAVTTGAVASPEMIAGSPLLRAQAYGPESEGATAADKSQLHGAFIQNLQKGHIAVSPDLLGKYPPHSSWDAVDVNGNIVRRGLTVADKSYIDPKNPTHNTVELYNDQDLGHVRLIPAQQYQYGGFVTDPETGMDLSQSNQDLTTAGLLASQASAAQAPQLQGFQRGGFARGTGGGGGGTELGGSDMMPPTKTRHRRFRPRMPGQQQDRMAGPDIPDEMQRKLAKLSHDYLSGLSGLIQSRPQLGPALLRHARNQLASNIGTGAEDYEQQAAQQQGESGMPQQFSPAQYAMTARSGGDAGASIDDYQRS